MSKEYYTIEKKNNLGELNVGLSVFQSIVTNTVNEIDGVDFDKKNHGLDIVINDDNRITINMDIIVKYGMHVSKLVNNVQNDIVNAINDYVGFRNVKVNANVNGIKF